MEKKKPVNVIEVDYICDKCHAGNMIYTRDVYNNYSLKYEHLCTNCTNIEEFDVKYPIYKYEPVVPDMIGPLSNTRY